ncbi:MerR family transcriptional regulator [Aureivirga sp. CE67]|uniref:MerR family transcriptional regulator n=1 Tax=Aureivirga sp. CE67 TaxID=1788983 RepID=UPI0018CB08DD|nr:MerR family transcriptional regulator [Aureivirga sp. CE67]
MSNIIKTEFTIKDLENLSGIKAHTIRIWEKRYDLLSPNRTSGNIRYYDVFNFQKLLNIVLLYENGYKISKIAKLENEALFLKAKEVGSKEAVSSEAINLFKISMLQFDAYLFHKTYNELLVNKTFSEVFTEIFVPLLNEIGMLWQTNTLTPAQEHFISNLIAQKIQINIDKLQLNPRNPNKPVYVLFLPENEIHELGILYLQYELLLRNCEVIYLGRNVPLDNLETLFISFEKIIFITNFIITLSKKELLVFVKQISEYIKETKHEFWLVNRNILEFNFDEQNIDIQFFKSLENILTKI